jgi:hypothetical protein
MGSTSGGLQGAGFGASFGNTWNDVGCDRRYNAQMLQNLGLEKAAVVLMCMDPAVREAMQMAGTPCVGMPAVKHSEAVQHTDPYVRARLGMLPILK